jgi:hypothetical protein
MRRFVIVLAVAAAGCRQNDDPDGAKALYAKVNAGAGFKSAPWSRAPGFPERKPSFSAHSTEVEIWINEPMVKALAGPDQITAWPEGSIVVKEGFASATKRNLVAIMEKRRDGWYFTELDGDGEPLWSASDGKPSICIDCHDNRASYSDSIYSFELPR